MPINNLGLSQHPHAKQPIGWPCRHSPVSFVHWSFARRPGTSPATLQPPAYPAGLCSFSRTATSHYFVDTVIKPFLSIWSTLSCAPIESQRLSAKWETSTPCMSNANVLHRGLELLHITFACITTTSDTTFHVPSVYLWILLWNSTGRRYTWRGTTLGSHCLSFVCFCTCLCFSSFCLGELHRRRLQLAGDTHAGSRNTNLTNMMDLGLGDVVHFGFAVKRMATVPKAQCRSRTEHVGFA